MIRAVIFDMFETLITHFACPPYFGAQMAQDAGIPEERFLPLWRQTDDDRALGKVTLEEALEKILRENQRYSEARIAALVEKRVAVKKACFQHLHPEILPMLSELKEKEILVGLISNCYSEEALVIRESELFPYFDVVCLSSELGIQKPDERIFRRCMEQLSVQAGECLYVGDGGSQELETARRLGMHALQAAWYLKEGTMQPVGRKEDFCQLETPLEVVKIVTRHKNSRPRPKAAAILSVTDEIGLTVYR